MTDQGNGQSTNGRSGYSGTSLFLMFLGGALAGAAGAYLAQARNRETVRALAARAQHAVGQLPQATRDASHAAKEAFVDAYNGSGEVAVAALAPKHA
jgi:ABC-type uncharacterized transport system permease subunit